MRNGLAPGVSLAPVRDHVMKAAYLLCWLGALAVTDMQNSLWLCLQEWCHSGKLHLNCTSRDSYGRFKAVACSSQVGFAV